MDELVVQAEEEERAALILARAEVDALRLQLQDLERSSNNQAHNISVLSEELELLRRDNCAMRECAEQDFEAANNWRRYVATVGEKRASLYLVPPRKEDGH